VACGAAQVGTVSVLRRVAAERVVQRLLVLAGLLIAGWLLGCAAQSAHADELPSPVEAVAQAPVLGEAVATVHQRQPVHRVVRAVAAEAPRAVDKEPQNVAPPPVREKSAGPEKTASTPASPRARHSSPPRVSKALPARVSKVSRTRSAAVRHETHDVVRHPSPPAPQRHGDHSDGGGVAATGVTAGFPATAGWAPAPPRASLSRVLGAVPPLVRTAADEPSFAPD
jgi:hypothetical protein